MSIHINIDGTEKSISQPHANIDGVWKEVELEHANIDGTWKEVWKKEATYTINIYRYGSLYQTLSCTEGNSIQLPSIGIGYATSSSSTTVSYSSGASITPTQNMNLYAVYTYTVKLYKYGTLYSTLTAKSQNSTASFALPSPPVNSTDDAFYGWTTVSGSVEKSYNGGSAYNLSSCSLYAIFSYTEYTGQTSATASGKTNNDSSVTQSLVISLSNPVPGSKYTLSYTEYTPKQVTAADGPYTTKYSVEYTTGNTFGSTGNISGNSITIVSSYAPKGGAFKTGSYGDTPSGTVDTIKTVYYYSYISATISYTKYKSKTTNYRS